MIRNLFKPLALIICVMVSVPVSAQEPYNLTAPVQNLATLFHDLFGPHGLIVDSEAVLPDGSTHSAHFNGAFQAEFERINVAFVRQLGSLPIPSPARPPRCPASATTASPRPTASGSTRPQK